MPSTCQGLSSVSLQPSPLSLQSSSLHGHLKHSPPRTPDTHLSPQDTLHLPSSVNPPRCSSKTSDLPLTPLSLLPVPQPNPQQVVWLYHLKTCRKRTAPHHLHPAPSPQCLSLGLLQEPPHRLPAALWTHLHLAARMAFSKQFQLLSS